MGGEGGHGSRIFNGLEQSESKKQEEADSCYKFPLAIIIIIFIIIVEQLRSSRCLKLRVARVARSPSAAEKSWGSIAIVFLHAIHHPAHNQIEPALDPRSGHTNSDWDW